MHPVIIDVREKDEFLAEHIEGSINVPLTDFASHAPAILKQLSDRELIFMCRSGNRAKLAACSVPQMNVSLATTPVVYSGGITEWKKEGKPVMRFSINHLPILRQTHIAAGFLMILGFILSVLFHPYFISISVFVGSGLMVAGITGFCGMGLLLAKMPWNKSSNNKATTSTKTVSTTVAQN